MLNVPGILHYDFMLRAFEAGLVLAVVAPTIGIFFVVRRYSAMADTLAHVSLAGVAGGLFLGLAPVWSAFMACIVAILGIEWIRERRTIASDTIASLFLFGGLALGVVLIGLHPGGGVNVAQYLFGSVLTVSMVEVQQIFGVGFVTLVICGVLWRALFTVSLDEDVARVGGIPVRFLNRLLAVLGAATIAISINVVGVLLVGALMVIPVLSAMQFHTGFKSTWLIALVVSIASVIIGLTVSFYANLASGATIVLCSIGFFFLSFILSRLKK